MKYKSSITIVILSLVCGCLIAFNVKLVEENEYLTMLSGQQDEALKEANKIIPLMKEDEEQAKINHNDEVADLYKQIAYLKEASKPARIQKAWHYYYSEHDWHGDNDRAKAIKECSKKTDRTACEYADVYFFDEYYTICPKAKQGE